VPEPEACAFHNKVVKVVLVHLQDRLCWHRLAQLRVTLYSYKPPIEKRPERLRSGQSHQALRLLQDFCGNVRARQPQAGSLREVVAVLGNDVVPLYIERLFELVYNVVVEFLLPP